MAAVNLSRGQCDYCQDTILVVIDKVTRALVWRLEPGGMSRHKEERRALRTFRLFPDDPILTLVFRFDSIGCQDCGAGQIEEYWLRPRLTAESSLVFDTIWKGTVEFGDSGQPNGSGPLRENSASLTSLWPRRAYRLRRSVPAGWLPNPGSQRDPMTTDCRSSEAESGSVVFEFDQVLAQDPATLALSPSEPGRWRRHDVRPTVTFPFNLKANRLVYDRLLTEKYEPVRLGLEASHGGALIRGGIHRGLQLINRADGRVLRTVPNPECGEYRVLAVGWSADGTRGLAVIDTEFPELPHVLVSVTPDGEDDRWEGFLPEHYDLHDGFILDLPEPSANHR